MVWENIHLTNQFTRTSRYYICFSFYHLPYLKALSRQINTLNEKMDSVEYYKV